jgi:endonuclease-3 related protein
LTGTKAARSGAGGKSRPKGSPGGRCRRGRGSNRALRLRLEEIFGRLYGAFGPQHWWPGETPFEVAVGAILTQNTNWANAQKAISNLKGAGALSPEAIHRMPRAKLAGHIRPSGYFNVKAGRLKAFMDFLMEEYKGKMGAMEAEEAGLLRGKLLRVRGVGPETADSVLLYALGKPVFVIDAYTKRVLSRHGVAAAGEPYENIQGLFHVAFGTGPERTAFFNEYHALLVRVGKSFCKAKAACEGCPLDSM